MTGEGEGQNIVHFLSIGNSKDHASKAIDALSIEKMVVFTSYQILEETRSFCDSLSDKSINVLDIIPMDPFQTDSLSIMIQTVIEAFEKYSENGKNTIVSGLTGGTKLMAVALGIVSMLYGTSCNYIVHPPDNRVLEIDLFQKMAHIQLKEDILKTLRGNIR